MSNAVATAARTYGIDKVHSETAFQVRHLVTRVRGRFTDFEGDLVLDQAHPERSSATISVKTASVDTDNADRDAHLRSEDFFFAEKFPLITFVSTKVDARGANEFTVTGDLTIRGVTRSLSVPVTFLGTAKDPWGNERVGFESEITVNRKDFGLVWNAALETGGFLVGDEVRISVSLQAIAK